MTTKGELFIRLHEAEAEIKHIDAIREQAPAYYEQARDLARTRAIYARYCRMLRNQLHIQQPVLPGMEN